MGLAQPFTFSLQPEPDKLEFFKGTNPPIFHYSDKSCDMTKSTFLKNDTDLFESLVELSQKPTAVFDPEGGIIYANPAHKKLFGLSQAEMETRKMWDYHPRQAAEWLERELFPSLSEGENWEGEIEGLASGDRILPLWMQLESVLGDRQMMRFLIVQMYDLSKKMGSEAELQLLSTAIEQAAECVTVWDCDGNIRYVNPAFERASGYTKDEVVGKNPVFLRSGKHSAKFYSEIDETLRQGQIWRGRLINKRKNGSTYEVDGSICPVLDTSGKIIYYVSVRRDVTDEANLERQLRQVQKLEAIGTLAGGIAHDFNNILTAIMGNAELALHILNESSPVKKYVSGILKAGERARELVKQILTFSRRAEAERSEIRISSIVKEVLKLLRITLPTTIAIEEDIDTDIGFVLVDPVQIHQVLMNLCTNAFQAIGEEDGVLRVELKNVKPDAEILKANPNLTENCVRLTVSDTGCGMSSETMSHILEPFFTTKSVRVGTGMGLAVVHGIIKNYDGEIVVTSEPGKGSTFHVYLPEVLRHVAAEDQTVAASLPGGNERILLVDNDMHIVEVCGRMLEFLGYRVDVQTDSVGALEMFRKEPDRYDLVITGYTMPVMTGTALATELAGIRPAIPVILLTGYPDVVSSPDIKAAGFCAVMQKPVRVSELSKIVKNALAGRVNGG